MILMEKITEINWREGLFLCEAYLNGFCRVAVNRSYIAAKAVSYILNIHANLDAFKRKELETYHLSTTGLFPNLLIKVSIMGLMLVPLSDPEEVNTFGKSMHEEWTSQCSNIAAHDCLVTAPSVPRLLTWRGSMWLQW